MGRNNEDFANGIGKFYHGSPAKLNPGEYVTPRAERGIKRPTNPGPSSEANPDKVFVTPHYDVAYAFAGGTTTPTPGHVYEVEPIGKVEPDSEFVDKPKMRSYTAEAARVIRVIKQNDPVTTFDWKNNDPEAPDVEIPALKSGGDTHSDTRNLFPNNSPSKCRACGGPVATGEGLVVKTRRKGQAGKPYEIYHKEHLGNG